MFMMLYMWVVEEKGANTLSGNHIWNSITFASCSLSLLMVLIPPAFHNTSWKVGKCHEGTELFIITKDLLQANNNWNSQLIINQQLKALLLALLFSLLLFFVLC